MTTSDKVNFALYEALARNSKVQLLAVSKKQSADKIRALYIKGQRDFAESYCQEALMKMQTLFDLDIHWHFIGAIQSNKTAAIAKHFSWVQSVDREKIAKRLSEQRGTDLPSLNVCVQVNFSREPQKAGVLPEAVLPLLALINALPNLTLRGLMVLPKKCNNNADQLREFKAVSAFYGDCIAKGFAMDTLSMGMSQDYQLAIEAGSSMVRIGSALFGERRG